MHPLDFPPIDAEDPPDGAGVSDLNRPRPNPALDPERPRRVSRSEEAAAILSFDVEEHDRIEAAAGLVLDPVAKARYHDRVAPTTRWLLDLLDARTIRATFFVVGQYARGEPGLIRAIHRAGHEVASHGWDHRRVTALTPEEFREDVRTSKDTLEQITGEAVVGYRAPTFSVVRRTAWALDVLAELGLLYDSSIFPVRHDRYGIQQAPREPFLAEGPTRSILEFPPATLRVLGSNLPVGGGGYFRLLPPAVMRHAIAQYRRGRPRGPTMLYFHPWEFDPDQPRLPLRRLNRFRTYVGIGRARGRLEDLLGRVRFGRAADAADRLRLRPDLLPRFSVAEPPRRRNGEAAGAQAARLSRDRL